MAVAQLASEPRILLPDTSWQLYESLLQEQGNRSVRMTYDEGNLELMSPSSEHERFKHLLGRLIESLTLELGIAVSGGGSTTFKREDLQKGLDPDECYWIANESFVRDKREIDLAVDPPPDLAVEIDITRSHLNRQQVYAALGILEIWCYDGQSLRVFVLDQGCYNVDQRSRAFPFLPMAEFAAFLQRGMPAGETQWVRSFLDWVRREVVPRYTGSVEP